MSLLPANIIVLSHRLPYPPNKGEKIRTYNQLEHFRQSNCNVTVFCLIDSDDEKQLARQYASLSGFTVVTATARFRKLCMLTGLVKGRALSVSNFYNGKLQSLLDRYLKDNPVDAVYCTSSAMAEYLFKAELPADSAQRHKLELMDFMDLDSDKWRQYREISKFPMSLIYRYEESALTKYEEKIQRRFDACIFISVNEVALFRSRLSHQADNLHVVGNGVDLSQFSPRSEMVFEGPLTLLFSGVMDYFPNENAMCWFVDNVWPILKLQHPDARLVIAGMNPGAQILELAQDQNITVTGYVDDMLACYHQANVFIGPFQIARGVQNKILQAFACGLPVVTTAVGAEGIDCRNGEHLLIAQSPEQFVEKIDQLTKDSTLYEGVCKAALDLVHQSYTWDAKNESLAEVVSATGSTG